MTDYRKAGGALTALLLSLILVSGEPPASPHRLAVIAPLIVEGLSA